MKYIILILTFVSICGCKPKTEKQQAYIEVEGFKVELEDSRQALFYDFKQITEYPELIDDDYENGELEYTFYKKDDFVTVRISGVGDEEIIKSSIEEFKTVMKKREINQYLVVNIYDKITRTSETSATLGNLIKTMEIKNF